jgi:hypothetical protein
MALTASVVQAEEMLSTPTGDVVLTVSGDIQQTNIGDTAQFDMDMLKAMDAKSFVTTTIWTDGDQTFTGVPLSALLDALGVDSGTLSASAINDYTVEIPVEDETTSQAIVAYMNNGEIMSVRDKGPLWIVYPYDSDDSLWAEVVFSRSIWQLDRIKVAE